MYYLAQAQFFNEAYSRADSSFAMVLESTPNYAPAWIMRAKCNVNLDPDNVNFLAKPYFEKYVEVAEVDKAKEYVKKNLILAYNYLGVYFVQQNDNTTAKSWFARTITLDPNDATASDALRILNKNNMVPAIGSTYKICDPPSGGFFWIYIRIKGFDVPGASEYSEIFLLILQDVE